MVPNGPSPHPHPWHQQKSPAGGANKLEKNTFVMVSYNFHRKIKKIPCQGSARKLHPPFSREDPKRGNPTMTPSTISARRKGDRQYHVEGKTKRLKSIKNQSMYVYIYIYNINSI